MNVAVVGASGFVGTAVTEVLRTQVAVTTVRAPRLASRARSVGDLRTEAASCASVQTLVNDLHGVDVLVNAAGDPDASSMDEDALYGANALLPAVLLEAARIAGVRRLVHVSSAVVQNDKPMLDSSEDLRPFSPYSASKCLGEESLRNGAIGVSVVRYRPPSVHAASRRVTRMIRRIASSPAATVARPGDQPTPQALLPNVAAAVAHLATTQEEVPPVVHHPSEGVTVSSLMEDLSGGRRPTRIPRWAAVAAVRIAKKLGKLHKPTAANARRLELLWVGQSQETSWLTATGWSAPVGREGWRALAEEES